MRYKDFEGTIEELVSLKLTEIEQKEHIRILHAVESGSRAWGFASPDSDYDVRFVYIRPMKDYLRLEDTQDFINWELDETLDMNGWDLKKALRQFHRSNATLYEWSNSPVVYHTTSEWERIRKVSEQYFSCKSSMYHYYGTANKNYNEYLLEEMVKYKKYFYALRPILACQWIEERRCPPPVRFADLAEAVFREETEENKVKKELIWKLLEQKMQMAETEKGKRVDEMNEYIKENIAIWKERAINMLDDRNPNWEQLNQLFLEIVKG